MGDDTLQVGLHEALLTGRLEEALQELGAVRFEPSIVALDAGSVADRISRHLAALIAGAIDTDDDDRVQKAVDLADAIAHALVASGVDAGVLLDVPLQPPRVLQAIYARQPDGSARPIDAPLTPLARYHRAHQRSR